MWCKKGQISLLCEFETQKRIDLATSNYILPQLEVVSFMMVPLRHVVYYIQTKKTRNSGELSRVKKGNLREMRDVMDARVSLLRASSPGSHQGRVSADRHLP